ncbi:conserved hypothetical protein [Roseibium sp. TrichSKD4]|nr:conserved hypothetical protein [Roseibium sp. TrichSKD4]
MLRFGDPERSAFLLVSAVSSRIHPDKPLLSQIVGGCVFKTVKGR